MANYIELEKGKIYGIPLRDGYLRVDVSQDENYPGLDIEYIGKSNDKTNPRVLIEAPKDDKTNIRALIWNNPEEEDYQEEIDLA